MVQFAETDLAGVLHFSNYFRLMEEVEHAFWRSLGSSVVLRDRGGAISWPRVRVSCEYAAPLHFEDELTLTLRVVEVGERSLRLEVDFVRAGVRVARGELKVVCCQMRGGRFRSISIPAEIRAKLLEPGRRKRTSRSPRA